MTDDTTGTVDPTAPSPVTRGVTGAHTTEGLPHGYTSLTPHLVVRDATRALDFYRDVLGAHVLDVMRIGDAVAHAVVELPVGRFTLSDALEAYGLVGPQPVGEDGTPPPVSCSYMLYVTDVDAVTAAAERAGALVREAPSAFVSGDRFASVLDPFGVRWNFMTRVEDLAEEESARRVAAWAATQGEG